MVTNHSAMVGMFLQDFKYRMGCTDGICMGFNLDTLIKRVDWLEELSRPFSDEEINLVIKQMPSDRAMGQMALMG